MRKFKWLALVLALFLAGCKVELYQNLPQSEANQMVALLMLNNIDASSEADAKTGKVTLKIEKDQFINAVELLRQNGYPKADYVGIEQLFPSGQLVSSPAQEEAKMSYLKEQQLERTLSSMDGVISSRVSLAQGHQNNNSGRNVPSEKSAAIYIKYSPEANLSNSESQIRNLIKNAVPDLQYENISLFLQPADFRYQPVVKPNQTDWDDAQNWVANNKTPVTVGLGSVFIAGIAGLVLGRRKEG
ncbi:type III secretion system inner membrane ring lipoprotein SctJ [Vibrio ostreicida]|uniref:Lipoprotein n=1 Tax=Vibrio ostreicida TaxID=526588 RepID=A0ABT8BSE0_9VIBR|nr:type III secretion inner membrane ring lipoprotein SctJ [Vibrio ostreicida]MDN3610020.1 type III secretion inner membrane ring lipoprotein SctJ [Vibrio ostreicida]MDN3611188.1 type III secretion inner membrane ring lipoprotein SctJ [Vibrio ostreicida]NPD10445.1 type III secretion inner membrane ring lipoprotein SctJ [Vibrio ostreicida]